MAMFIFAVGLAWMAVKFLGADGANPVPLAGASASAIAVLTGIMALYNIVLAINVLANRLPPGVWPRLEHIEANARRPRPSAR